MGGGTVVVLAMVMLAIGSAAAQADGNERHGAHGALFVVNEITNELSALDAATGAALATVPVGTNPIGLTILRETGRIYVANQGSNTVSVVSTETMTVIKTIATGPKPHDVWRSPDEGYVYVTEFGTPASPSNTVALIDTTTDTIVARFTVGPSGSRSHAVWIPKNGGTLYVMNFGPPAVYALDPLTGETRWTLAVPSNPVHLVTTSDGRTGYLTLGSGAVAVVDLLSPSIMRTIPVGAGPASLWLSPNGKWLAVAHGGGQSISIIDLAHGDAVTTISLGATPGHVVISEDSKHAYIGVGGSSPKIAVFSLRSQAMVREFPLAAGAPHGILFVPGDFERED
jgi:YVTN family beta-propeller protein